MTNFFSDWEMELLNCPGCSANPIECSSVSSLTCWEPHWLVREHWRWLCLLSKAGLAVFHDRSTGHILWLRSVCSWGPQTESMCPSMDTCWVSEWGAKIKPSTTEQEAVWGLAPAALLVIFHALNKNIKRCDFFQPPKQTVLFLKDYVTRSFPSLSLSNFRKQQAVLRLFVFFFFFCIYSMKNSSWNFIEN